VLRLLLDEHISPSIAVQLRAKRAGIEVVSLKEWGYLGESDEVIITNAYYEGLTFVTYDLRTIPSLLKSWGEEGKTHGGVIFID
jgi:predicted nuclease of predicted toxin-antitoxin system